ncbi:MAG: PIG-L family deacetylase [Bacteroidetes bacterium]|nr:PIG-L family deacetylase [Bacteroidota bacterium]
MLSVHFASRPEGLRILCLGAHCDDIEIGCGGTIMRLANEHKIRQLKWLVFTSSAERDAEARLSAEYFVQRCKEKEIIIKKFKDGFLPYEAAQIKNLFEELKSFNPDIIFTHCRHDLHQDHRTICELTWNTFRDHLIFEYEIPKYDGDLGSPNCFITLEEEVAEKKVETIIECFRSQAGKQWFDEDTFFSLMRIRGLESASPTKYAEGFYVKKSVM